MAAFADQYVTGSQEQFRGLHWLDPDLFEVTSSHIEPVDVRVPAGGSDDHQRGVHAGVIRISGRAPDDLVFDLPLGRFRSGDAYIHAPE